jgi:hypothetical protein
VNNRRFSAKNIHRWVKNLPVGHLQLDRQAIPERESSSTIAEMIDALERGAFSHRSPTAAQRIDRTLNALLRTLDDGRPDNWDRFRRSRPPLRSYKAIYFASPRLRALNARERKLALAKAHLSRRAINALEKAHIETIGHLITRAERGIVDLAGLGVFKGLEVIASLDALADAIQTDGSVDWLKFAQLRKFVVLPRSAIAATPREFIREFPRVCEIAIATTFKENAGRVLKTHLLRGTSAYNARTKTGKLLNLSRESIRLHENEIVHALRSAIWDEDYCGCKFRFRREFVAPLLELQECLLQKTSPNLRSSWAAALQESWGVDPQAVSNQEILLLRLLRREARSFQREKDSFVASQRQLGYTDRCEVILRARGAPMRLRDLNSAIVAESSERNRRKIKLTSALLSASRRFVPLGRTGYWALREWQDMETHAIPDMTAELLNLPRDLYTTSQ